MILIIYYAGLSGMVECQTGDGSQKVEQQIQCYACGLPKVCYILETFNFFGKIYKIAFLI